jgi:hypothetical protein
MSESLEEALAAVMASIAYSIARREKLEQGGVIYCRNCSRRPALMPSLHCPPCLAEVWRRTGSEMRCENREQTEEDVRACAR